jgi:hypothetical protein
MLKSIQIVRKKKKKKKKMEKNNDQTTLHLDRCRKCFSTDINSSKSKCRNINCNGIVEAFCCNCNKWVSRKNFIRHQEKECVVGFLCKNKKNLNFSRLGRQYKLKIW